MSAKQSPKSCSCDACKRGKGTKPGKYRMKRMERAMRTQWRNQRLQPEPEVAPAPMGNYFD
jgi:hypothetical protein